MVFFLIFEEYNRKEKGSEQTFEFLRFQYTEIKLNLKENYVPKAGAEP